MRILNAQQNCGKLAQMNPKLLRSVKIDRELRQLISSDIHGFVYDEIIRPVDSAIFFPFTPDVHEVLRRNGGLARRTLQ